MTDTTVNANVFTIKDMLRYTSYMTLICTVGLSIGFGFSTALIWAAGRLATNIDMLITLYIAGALTCFFLWLAFFYLVKTGWID